MKPVAQRPRNADGELQPFDCCILPYVYQSDDGEASRCTSCGYEWTEELSGSGSE